MVDMYGLVLKEQVKLIHKNKLNKHSHTNNTNK